MVIGLAQSDITQINSPEFYSQSQTKQVELANSYIGDKQNPDSSIDLQVEIADNCEGKNQLENNDHCPFPPTKIENMGSNLIGS